MLERHVRVAEHPGQNAEIIVSASIYFTMEKEGCAMLKYQALITG